MSQEDHLNLMQAFRQSGRSIVTRETLYLTTIIDQQLAIDPNLLISEEMK